jgi:hypothetical protein
VPRYEPLSVGVVLLDLVATAHHQPDLSPLIDRINDRYGRCAIGLGLFPPDVRAFEGHAAFSPGAGEVGVLRWFPHELFGQPIARRTRRCDADPGVTATTATRRNRARA